MFAGNLIVAEAVLLLFLISRVSRAFAFIVAFSEESAVNSKPSIPPAVKVFPALMVIDTPSEP